MLLALGADTVTIDGKAVIGIPVPASIDMEKVYAYGIDAYGDLCAIEVEYDVENRFVYIHTDVLGSFILVEGEVALGGNAPAGDDEPADTTPDAGDDEGKKNDKKNDKKDDKSNGALLWIILGGVVVLLAAGGIVTVLVIKKKKAA